MIALETISRECFRSFGVLRDAVLLDGKGLFGVSTDVPLSFFNGIATTRLRDGNANERVSEVVDRFRAKGRPFRWWITPESTPGDLAEVLKNHGMTYAWDATGMTADLATIDLDVKVTDDLRIARVRGDAGMHVWASVLAAVFHRPDAEQQMWCDAFGQCGFDDHSSWAHFVGLLDDVPVATSSVLLTGDLAGIYHVGTLPDARGRGIGSALTAAALRLAKERGAKQAVLQSSDMGESVYRSLGFISRARLSLYVWS